jgi:hypothetical protein
MLDEILNSVKDTYREKFNCTASKLDFLKVHGLTENLSCNFEGLSFNMKAVIYICMTSESKKDILALKIYSYDFTSEESVAICRVGKHLIRQKCLEFESVLQIMEQKKSNGCSRSFEVAGSFILEYIKVLKRAEKLVV